MKRLIGLITLLSVFFSASAQNQPASLLGTPTSAVRVRGTAYADSGTISPSTPDWWGAKADGITDDAAPVQSALNYSFNQYRKIDSTLGSRFGLLNHIPIVKLERGRVYVINSPIYIRAGQTLDLNGATIKAGAAMRFMVRTYDEGSYVTGFFGQRGIVIKNGTIDGNNLAEIGLFTRTITNSIVDNITFVRCIAKQWSDSTRTTPQVKVGNNRVRMSSVTNVSVYDVIRFFDTTNHRYRKGAYQVTAISGDTLTLESALVEDVAAGDYVDNFPVGCYLTGNENTFSNLKAFDNTIGFFFTTSGTNIGFDDNKYDRLFAKDNNMAVVFESVSKSTIVHSTFQFSKYENITAIDGEALNIDVYCEGISTFKGIGNEDYSLIYLQGDWYNLKAYIPTDNALGWYRPIVVSADHAYIDFYGSPSGTQDENPTHAGDYALVKALGLSNVRLRLNGIENLSLADSIRFAIINSSYVFPVNNCYVYGTDNVTKKPIYYGNDKIDIGLFGDQKQYPSIDMKADGLYFGPGTAAPEIKLARSNTHVLSLDSASAFRLYGHWDSGLLRFNATRLWWNNTKDRIYVNFSAAPTNDSDGYPLAYLTDTTSTLATKNYVDGKVKDVDFQTYTGTVTFTGTTAPSGTQTGVYRWSQEGKKVTLFISIKYSVAGSAVTVAQLSIPADCPAPAPVSGLTSANQILYQGAGGLSTTTTVSNQGKSAIVVNSTATGYAINVVNSSVAAQLIQCTITYWTNSN